MDLQAAERVGRLSDAHSASRGSSQAQRRQLVRGWLQVILEGGSDPAYCDYDAASFVCQLCGDDPAADFPPCQ